MSVKEFSDKTVIFDFDGTLVDSFLSSFHLSNKLAPIFGYRKVTIDEVPALRKLSALELLKNLGVPLRKLPSLMTRARSDMKKDLPSIKMFEDMKNLLKSLKYMGIRLGVVTSNSIKNVELCLANNGVLDFFEFIHSASNLFGKHRVLNKLMKKRNLNNTDVVYVGDETRDIEASRLCKIPVIVVSWGFQDREKLLSFNPDFMADEPMDIDKYVKKIFG